VESSVRAAPKEKLDLAGVLASASLAEMSPPQSTAVLVRRAQIDCNTQNCELHFAP
jgi:hypothetical protein